MVFDLDFNLGAIFDFFLLNMSLEGRRKFSFDIRVPFSTSNLRCRFEVNSSVVKVTRFHKT